MRNNNLLLGVPLAVALLLAKVQAQSDITTQFPDYVSIWEGDWGDWQNQVNFPTDYYACGAVMRVEETRGILDDTAANGLILVACNYDNWNEQ